MLSLHVKHMLMTLHKFTIIAAVPCTECNLKINKLNISGRCCVEINMIEHAGCNYVKKRKKIYLIIC